MQGRGQKGEESHKGKNTKKLAVTCVECGANFFFEGAPNVEGMFSRGFWKRDGCFEMKLFSTFHPT